MKKRKEVTMKSIILSCLISMSCFASAETLTTADASAGKALVEQNCVSCHVESFGGDGSGIYTRELRKVKNFKELIAQIRSCHTMIGLKWFEDDELNVAKYLNQSYYKFTE